MEGYGELNYLYVDIETKPAGEPNFELLKTREELEKGCPKSYSGNKKEEWINNKLDSQVEDMNKEHRKGSLISTKAEIICIGMAYNNEEPIIIKYNKNQKHMLEEMLAWIEGIAKQYRFSMVWVGKNVVKFDIRMIWHRAVKYQIVSLMDLLPVEKWSKRVEDIGEMWDAYQYGIYTKMEDIAKFLDLEGKGDIDGSMVYDLFLEGKLDKIYDYCMNRDIPTTRNIHKMLKGLEPL
ncbi:MAG: hypothetical protein KAS32_22500 [Candidatus Peribacteraceae bacterium]|nr:hypothetical protein [Candidatus Peribacteraceae bacterium]